MVLDKNLTQLYFSCFSCQMFSVGERVLPSDNADFHQKVDCAQGQIHSPFTLFQMKHPFGGWPIYCRYSPAVCSGDGGGVVLYLIVDSLAGGREGEEKKRKPGDSHHHLWVRIMF